MGSAFGPFLFCWMPQKLGMRATLLALGVPFLVSQLMMAFSTVVEVFYVARFIEGLALGATYTITPNYLGEIAAKANRGALGSFYSIAGAFGKLFSYSLGPYVSTMAFNLVIAIIAAQFLVLFFLVGEEVPHYYLNNHDLDNARRVLQRLRGQRASKEITEMELEEIKTKLEADGSGNFLDIFRNRRLTKAFTLVIGLLVFQHLTGCHLASFYIETLFQEIGTSLSPDICTIVVGGVVFLSSFLSPHIVDRLGRKPTLYISSTGIIVSETVLAIYVYLQDQKKDLSNLTFIPVIAIAGTLFSYTFGLSFIPFIILGEIFPSKVKSSAATLVISFNSVLNFLITNYMEFFFSSIGIAYSFLAFAFCTVFCIVFCRFCLIETSGKSLEEIQKIL